MWQAQLGAKKRWLPYCGSVVKCSAGLKGQLPIQVPRTVMRHALQEEERTKSVHTVLDGRRRSA